MVGVVEGEWAVDQDWATFCEQLRSALDAFVVGDAAPYQRCWTANDDCTVFGAFGGVGRGAEEIRLRLGWAGSQYRAGRYTRFELVTDVRGSDLAVLAHLERVESLDDQGATIVRERRLTHVARKEADGWKVVHQHSDPLVEVRPPS